MATVIKEYEIQKGTFKDLKDTRIKVRLLEIKSGEYQVQAKDAGAFFGSEREYYKGTDMNKAIESYKELIRLVEL